jgi:hypothetical protein
VEYPPHFHTVAGDRTSPLFSAMSSVNNDLNGLTDAFEALTPNDWLALHQHSTAPDRSVIRRPVTTNFLGVQGAASSVNLHATPLKIWPLASPVPYKEVDRPGPTLLQAIAREHALSAIPKPFNPHISEGIKVEIRGLSQQPKQKKAAGMSGAPGMSPSPIEMTPVEQCAIPAVKKGNNVVVCIQSDKIAVSALLVPAIKRSLRCSNLDNPSQSRDYLKNSASSIGGHRIRMLAKSAAPSILILAPTKDVAERVFEVDII